MCALFRPPLPTSRDRFHCHTRRQCPFQYPLSPSSHPICVHVSVEPQHDVSTAGSAVTSDLVPPLFNATLDCSEDKGLHHHAEGCRRIHSPCGSRMASRCKFLPNRIASTTNMVAPSADAAAFVTQAPHTVC